MMQVARESDAALLSFSGPPLNDEEIGAVTVVLLTLGRRSTSKTPDESYSAFRRRWATDRWRRA